MWKMSSHFIFHLWNEITRLPSPWFLLIWWILLVFLSSGLLSPSRVFIIDFFSRLKRQILLLRSFVKICLNFSCAYQTIVTPELCRTYEFWVANNIPFELIIRIWPKRFVGHLQNFRYQPTIHHFHYSSCNQYAVRNIFFFLLSDCRRVNCVFFFL